MKLASVLAVLAAFATAASLTFSLYAAEDDVISKVMKKYHKAPKGTDPTCKKASNGQASEGELKELVAAYESIAAAKAPKGEADAWKEKMAALIAATKDLQAGKDGATEAYKKAVNCKSCHKEHKPD